MFSGLPDICQYASDLVRSRRLRGPLSVVLYHHLGDLLNACRHALTHYFPLTLNESFLQKSSHGTPYQKWAFFTNKDFQDVDECLRRFLIVCYRYYEETNQNSTDECVTLKDSWHWFHAVAEGYTCCFVERDEAKLALTSINLAGWIDPSSSRFLNVINRPPWEKRPDAPALVTKAIIDIDNRKRIVELLREGGNRLREIRIVHETFSTMLLTSFTMEDVTASHQNHLSTSWIGVTTGTGVKQPYR
jgi:hypothetical protein